MLKHNHLCNKILKHGFFMHDEDLHSNLLQFHFYVKLINLLLILMILLLILRNHKNLKMLEGLLSVHMSWFYENDFISLLQLNSYNFSWSLYIHLYEIPINLHLNISLLEINQIFQANCIFIKAHMSLIHVLVSLDV